MYLYRETVYVTLEHQTIRTKILPSKLKLNIFKLINRKLQCARACAANQVNKSILEGLEGGLSSTSTEQHKNISRVCGQDRQFCPEGHCLT